MLFCTWQVAWVRSWRRWYRQVQQTGFGQTVAGLCMRAGRRSPMVQTSVVPALRSTVRSGLQLLASET